MSKAKMVLMIGGPADGRWMVAEGPTIIVAKPQPIDWRAAIEDPVWVADIQRVEYRVQTCALFGLSLDVAVAEREFRSSGERESAVVRALFQRDVAEAMGAYR